MDCRSEENKIMKKEEKNHTGFALTSEVKGSKHEPDRLFMEASAESCVGS
jgi:hypothetical protein